MHEHKTDCKVFIDAKISLLESETKEYQEEIKELRKQTEHWKQANEYNLFICKNQSELISKQHRQIELLRDALKTIKHFTADKKCIHCDQVYHFSHGIFSQSSKGDCENG